LEQRARSELVLWPSDMKAQCALIKRAGDLIRAGEVIAFPTDTVYGIAADPANEDAVKRLYDIKERPPHKAIALLISEYSQMAELSDSSAAGLELLSRTYWPGALTIVVPSRPDSAIKAGQPFATVGLRMPDHLIPLALVEEVGHPLATTSANLSGSPSAVTAEEVNRQIGDRVALIIDGGSCPVGCDSTVVDVTTTPPTVRRAGAVPVEKLVRILGPVTTPS
jgi:L-threonylcarbamoyladenylate synthase